MMGLKSSTRLDEGPLDFVRGASQVVGNKVANTAVNAAKGAGRAVGQVYQAGKTASQHADLERAVLGLVKLLAAPAPAQRQEPTTPTPQQQSDVPDAFRTTQKPRGRMGQNGFEFTFDSFMQQMYGDDEQLDEGMWDFMKGAGGAVADKARAAIDSYAGKPSVFKDIYQAGKDASVAGNEQRTTAKAEQAAANRQNQINTYFRKVVELMNAMGKGSGNVVWAILQKHKVPNASRLFNKLAKAYKQQSA